MSREIMHHLILGNDNFEIVDKEARESIEELVGSFVPKELLASANLNSIIIAGTYAFEKTGTASPSNQPAAANTSSGYPSFQMVVYDNGQTVHQIYYDSRDGLIALRLYEKTGGQWTAWKVIAVSHAHAASDVTSGTFSSDRLPTVPITKGGTGSTTAAGARSNLEITPVNIGAAPTSHNHAASAVNSGTFAIDRIPTITVAKGGTGAATAAAARTNLGITPANIGAAASAHTHAASDVNSGTLGIDRLPTVTVAKGGTGGTTKATGRSGLGITSGTSAPSGGDNGDIYFQYS